MRHCKQDGFVLLAALILIAVMTLIAVGLIRSVDSTNEVVNNIAFKEATLLAADRGAQQAVTWLAANQAALNNDNAAEGYCRALPEYVDYTGQVTTTYGMDDVNWKGTGAGCLNAKVVSTDALGNTVSYVIHRLCSATAAPPGWSGNVDPAICITSTSSSSGGGSGGSTDGQNWTVSSSQVGYRITVQSAGPKNSSSYTQTLAFMGY